MKKIISFVLAAVLLVSAVPTALATNDYSQGTQVVYEATGSESYTITVPAQLAPGGSGTVTLSGTWADNRIVTVTADPTVTLKNSIKAEDQKVLNVNFDGISEAGSNIGSQTFTEGVSVDDITNALFGTWSGKFNYNVAMSDVAGGSTTEPSDPDTGDGEEANLITFTIDGKEYQAEKDMLWSDWITSQYNTGNFTVTADRFKHVLPPDEEYKYVGYYTQSFGTNVFTRVSATTNRIVYSEYIIGN